MLRTYKAVLREDRIEWIDAPPEHSHATPVHITVLEATPNLSLRKRGRAMAEVLEELANAGGLLEMEDPVAWQRQVRHDRVLYER